jgi:hypothetical protein
VPWIQASGMIAVSLLFGVVGFYLTLIAKFYRQKFSKGPPHRWMQAALVVTVAGLILKLDFLGAYLPAHLPSMLVCAGGLVFSALAYRLYRSMMSVN